MKPTAQEEYEADYRRQFDAIAVDDFGTLSRKEIKRLLKKIPKMGKSVTWFATTRPHKTNYQRRPTCVKQ